MDTNQLKFFCTIVELGSLTKASEVVNISHSGLSKSMKLLQEEVNLKLLRPLGRGLEITEEGKEFYEKAKKILTGFSELKEKKNPTAHFLKVGLTEVLSLVSSELFCILQGLNIQIMEIDSGNMEVEIQNDHLDFGFTFTPFPVQYLEYLKICDVNLGVFSSNKRFQEFDFSQIPFIVPAHDLKDNPLSIRARDSWKEDVFTRLITYRVSHLSIGLNIAMGGKAAIFIPKFLAKIYNNNFKSTLLHEIKLPHPKLQTSRSIYLVKKRNIDESKEMKKICSQIRKISKS